MFAAAILGSAGAVPAAAQSWRVEPTIDVLETLTSNVNLSPASTRQWDLVTQITPTLTVDEQGQRTSLHGIVSLPILLYVKTGAENNQVYPHVDLLGDVQLVDRFLHIEGSVNISQQYFNPFGAQPTNLVNATQNRYQTEVYRVSPYISGTTAGNISYELRNNNIWSNLSSAPIDTADAFTTEWLAKASNVEARVGWRSNVDYSETKFTDQQNSIRTLLGRVEPIYNYDAQTRFNAKLGYEDNQYQLTGSRNVIYGAGFAWRPTERTAVIGDWEHRFFGSSYLFSFDHRTPLSVWNVRVSRNITTYPQQVAALTAGVSVFGLINDLFRSNFPDPVERQRAVDKFISDRGLPTVLSSPISLYAQQILLLQSQTATVGLIGVRNTIMLTLFNLKTETISAAGNSLPAFGIDTNNTQTGVTLNWTNKLTEAVQLLVTINGARSLANAPLEGKTNQGSAQVFLSTPLSARTSFYTGARYQVLVSDISPDYHEVAAFVGLNYKFN